MLRPRFHLTIILHDIATSERGKTNNGGCEPSHVISTKACFLAERFLETIEERDLARNLYRSYIYKKKKEERNIKKKKEKKGKDGSQRKWKFTFQNYDKSRCILSPCAIVPKFETETFCFDRFDVILKRFLENLCVILLLYRGGGNITLHSLEYHKLRIAAAHRTTTRPSSRWKIF